MWEICLDISLPELFQHAVEFKKDSENTPDFAYGEAVSPVSHADITGKIRKIFQQ